MKKQVEFKAHVSRPQELPWLSRCTVCADYLSPLRRRGLKYCSDKCRNVAAQARAERPSKTWPDKWIGEKS